MKRFIKASEELNANAIVDTIILQLEDMIKYAKDINEAITCNDGKVYDVEELNYDTQNILDELKEAYADMGKMAEWQKIFKF
jgi:hypothetical protein